MLMNSKKIDKLILNKYAQMKIFTDLLTKLLPTSMNEKLIYGIGMLRLNEVQD